MDEADWPVTTGSYTEVWPPIDTAYAYSRITYTWPPCRVYWGSHGCDLPRGHDGLCDCGCCTCASHPDEDSGCVGKAPYYGDDTLFYGEDAEALGLPLARDWKEK